MRICRRSARYSHSLSRKGVRVVGYIADGEYWILGDVFEEVAGGAREAAALKKELFSGGLLVTDRRGKGVSYVVKRPLPDGTRPFFVVIRRNAKKSPGRGQGLVATYAGAAAT